MSRAIVVGSCMLSIAICIGSFIKFELHFTQIRMLIRDLLTGTVLERNNLYHLSYII